MPPRYWAPQYRERGDREEDCGLSEVQKFEDANSAVVCPLIIAYFLGNARCAGSPYCAVCAAVAARKGGSTRAATFLLCGARSASAPHDSAPRARGLKRAPTYPFAVGGLSAANPILPVMAYWGCSGLLPIRTPKQRFLDIALETLFC